jgi:hypothetical protein
LCLSIAARHGRNQKHDTEETVEAEDFGVCVAGGNSSIIYPARLIEAQAFFFVPHDLTTPKHLFICITIHRRLRGLQRIIPGDTNPKILRFHRFLRVVLLIAATQRCVAKVFVAPRDSI